MILALSVTSYSAYGQYIPKGFQHFYEYEQRSVMFTLSDSFFYEGTVTANYYNIDKIQNIDEFYDALIGAGVKRESVEEVTNAILNNEIKNDKIQVDFSYDSNTLQVDVSSEYMNEGKGDVEYTKLEPDDRAIIINNRIYSSYYDDFLSGTLNNNLVIGLGSGYIETDMSIFADNKEKEDTEFDVNGVKYEYNFEGNALQFGYASYSVEKDNSTSALDFSHSRENFYVSLSSSDNLLAVNDLQQKKLYFDIRASGTVDVVRDGKTLFSQSYAKGQHYISYAKLPRGNYDVELVIRADGYAEERILRRISNNISKTSHKGYDYNFTFRRSEYDKNENEETLIYGEASFTKSLFSDSLVLGINSRTDGDDIDIGSSAIYYQPYFGAAGYYNLFKDGVFYNTSLNLFGLSLDYEKLAIDDSDSNSPLLAAVYGQESYDQTSLSYSFPIGYGNVTLFGSKLSRDVNEGYSNKIENTNLAVNYQTNIFSNISMDVGYSLTVEDKNRDDRDGVISMNISIPLGDEHLSYVGGFESSNRNNGRITSTLSYQNSDLGLFSSVDSSGGASVSNNLDGEQSENSLSGYVNLDNQKFRASGYGNYSNLGNSNLSMTFESTSIISDESILQSRDFERSYIIVDSKDVDDNDDNVSDLSVLDLQINNGRHSNERINEGSTLIGLSDFTTYKFKLDNDISGYRSTDNSSNKSSMMFSYPGSVHTVSNEVEQVISFLSYFEDFNDKSLNNIKCLGDGCVSASRVGDGIYSISLVKDKSFKIISNDQYCFVTPGELQRNKAKSRCFPTIEEDENGMQLVTSGLGKDGENIYYLGILDDAIPDELRQAMMGEDIEYIEYEFAQDTYLFAKLKNRDSQLLITSTQMEVINGLQLYVQNSNKANSFTQNR